MSFVSDEKNGNFEGNLTNLFRNFFVDSKFEHHGRVFARAELGHDYIYIHIYIYIDTLLTLLAAKSKNNLSFVYSTFGVAVFSMKKEALDSKGIQTYTKPSLKLTAQT